MKQNPGWGDILTTFSLPMADHLYQGNHDGPSIYTHNYILMDQVIKRPENAETLLKVRSITNTRLFNLSTNLDHKNRQQCLVDTSLNRYAKSYALKSGLATLNNKIQYPSELLNNISENTLITISYTVMNREELYQKSRKCTVTHVEPFEWVPRDPLNGYLNLLSRTGVNFNILSPHLLRIRYIGQYCNWHLM